MGRRSTLVWLGLIAVACHRSPTKAPAAFAERAEVGAAPDAGVTDDPSCTLDSAPIVGTSWLYVYERGVGWFDGTGMHDEALVQSSARARVLEKNALRLEPAMARGEPWWTVLPEFQRLAIARDGTGAHNAAVGALVGKLVELPSSLERAGPDLEDEARVVDAVRIDPPDLLAFISYDSERIAVYEASITITKKDFGMGSVMFIRRSLTGRIALRVDDGIVVQMDLVGSSRWMSGPHHDAKGRRTSFGSSRAANVDMRGTEITPMRVRLSRTCP